MQDLTKYYNKRNYLLFLNIFNDFKYVTLFNSLTYLDVYIRPNTIAAPSAITPLEKYRLCVFDRKLQNYKIVYNTLPLG